MTNKQIIIYKKECYNEPYCSFNQVLEQLKAKEQECYEYIKELTRFQQEVVPKLRKRLRTKGQECEKLKEDYAELLKLLQRNNDSFEQFEALKQENETLKKIIKNNETAYTTEINIYNRASEDLLKENTELSEENNILKQSENEAIEIIAELDAKNKVLKEFIDYVSEVCKERITFEKPNEDVQSCLNFINNTFNDFELRIKDLKLIGVLK